MRVFRFYAFACTKLSSTIANYNCHFLRNFLIEKANYKTNRLMYSKLILLKKFEINLYKNIKNLHHMCPTLRTK